MIPTPSETREDFSKSGHPIPVELAPLPGFPEIQRHPGFQERLTHSRGRRKWEPRLVSQPPGSLQVQPAASQRQRGVRKVARVGLCVAARTKADSPLSGRYGGCLRGISRGLLHAGRFRCRTAHGSVRLRSGRATKRAKAFVSGEGRSHVGVPGFRVDRLQNLVSGVWLKRRVSVAAEASGRGLDREG